MTRVRQLLLVLAALALSACRVAPPLRVSGELTWSEVGGEGRGEDVEVAVSPGDVVRIATDAPVRVGEVIHAPEGDAVVWRTERPRQGAAYVRAGLFTSALRVPRGAVSRAHVGRPRGPEFAWFELESRALAWADGPLGAPFPDLAMAPRVEAADIAAIDAALAEAARGAPDPEAAARASRAIRTLVALRIVRTLEALRGFPYALNAEVHIASGAPATRNAPAPSVFDGRSFVPVRASERPAEVGVDGPCELFVWVRAQRGEEPRVEDVKVTEAGRVRGHSRALVRRARSSEKEPAQLRRIQVHVPPGRHEYRIELGGGGDGFLSAETSRPVLRIEDAFTGKRHERGIIADARRACEGGRMPSLCAMALALAGEDASLAYERAASAASASGRRVAQLFAEGGPFDAAAVRELAAADADRTALAELADAAMDSIDASERDGWERATLRSTSWVPVGRPSGSWFALAGEEASPDCGAGDGAPGGVREIDARGADVPSAPWRNGRALRLLAVAGCDGAEPIRLEVDGEVLSAQPSSGRATWHVIVRGESARVRRIDGGPGKVYAIADDACATGGASVPAASPTSSEAGNAHLLPAPAPLSERRTLAYAAQTRAPGVDVWLREGSAGGAFSVRSADGREEVTVDVRPRAASGRVALDEHGARWVRVARVPLPAWAAAGASCEGLRAGSREPRPVDGPPGLASIAVRAIARGVRADAPRVEAREVARPADPEALTRVSRELLAAPAPERGAIHLRRALLLASYGASRAALADAEAARRLGATGERGEDPVTLVQRSLAAPAPTSSEARNAPVLLARAPRPIDVAAPYGLEPDFDADAARCAAPGNGPRARVSALDAALHQRAADAPYDRSLAVRAVQAAQGAPGDPRAESVVRAAERGSRWKLVREVDGGLGRVPRPFDSERDSVFDAEGHLRARIAAGDPFGADFVIVTGEHAARASLAGLGAARIRVDAVCFARTPLPDAAPCAPTYQLGDGAPVPLAVGANGATSAQLPRLGRGKDAELTLAVAPSSADHVVVARIVLDAPARGATNVPGVGWVLAPPHTHARFLVAPGKAVRIKVQAPTLLRVDARAEGAEPANVVATVDGHDVPIPASGEPAVLPIEKSEEVVVSARSAPATIAVAERVPLEATSAAVATAPASRPLEFDPSGARVDLGEGRWRAIAESSPRPLTWLEDRLGTLQVDAGGDAATLRNGSRLDTGLDAFAFTNVMYRRRLEAPNLYTFGGGTFRLRDGPSSYGGVLGFYEDLDSVRLRITGTASVTAQDVAGHHEATLTPRGFVEYSWRVLPNFFVLPRFEYDGVYGTLSAPPASTQNVDDEVFNAFRLHRATFLTYQTLLWYVPHFNDIFYLRLRGTYDAANGEFSHASTRPGMFLIFGPAEMAAYFDAQWFVATPGARMSSGFDLAGGASFLWHAVVVPGSVEVRPTVSTMYRFDDATWQVIGGLSLVTSFRRGVRDYSSLELEFPEETSGGVPWRTENRIGP